VSQAFPREDPGDGADRRERGDGQFRQVPPDILGPAQQPRIVELEVDEAHRLHHVGREHVGRGAGTPGAMARPDGGPLLRHGHATRRPPAASGPSTRRGWSHSPRCDTSAPSPPVVVDPSRCSHGSLHSKRPKMTARSGDGQVRERAALSTMSWPLSASHHW
jgi:hypothetical protein